MYCLVWFPTFPLLICLFSLSLGIPFINFHVVFSLTHLMKWLCRSYITVIFKFCLFPFFSVFPCLKKLILSSLSHPSSCVISVTVLGSLSLLGSFPPNTSSFCSFYIFQLSPFPVSFHSSHNWHLRAIIWAGFSGTPSTQPLPLSTSWWAAERGQEKQTDKLFLRPHCCSLAKLVSEYCLKKKI